jgi:phospholipid/cholesterol/gamma-HCH transport system substrate-binding protein
METRANYVLVGGSVLAAIFAIVVFVFWLGHSAFNHVEDVYYTYFSGSVSGLSAGSPVRYRGVPVGTVGEIVIDPQDVERIRVTLKINPHTPIKTDTVAALESGGITGNSYIELTGGMRASPPLVAEDGSIPVIQSSNSSLTALIDDAPKLLGKLQQLADSANGALSAENLKALSETLAHLDKVAANLEAMGPDLRHAVGNFSVLTDDLHNDMPKLLKTVQDDGASIKGAADEFHKVAANLDGLVTENRGPLREFTSQGLSQVSGLITELRTLTGTLDRVADRLDRDPQRYLFGGSVAGGIDPNQPLAATLRGGTPR